MNKAEGLLDKRWLYAMKYYDHYNSPPADLPQVLAWGLARCKGQDLEMEQAVSNALKPHFSGPMGLNPFWPSCLYHSVIYLPSDDPKLMDPEKLVGMRLKRKTTEFKKKSPLFWQEELIEWEKTHPGYFSVEVCRRHQDKRKRILARQAANFAALFPPEREIILKQREEVIVWKPR